METATGAWFFFDEPEREVVSSALAWVDQADPALSSRVRDHLDRLGALAAVIRDSASITASWPSSEALVELLCRVPEYDVELHMPTRAVIGQAYLVAKINFFKSLGYALAATGGPEALRERMADEVGQSIYSKIVEELFITVVTDPEVARPVKSRASEIIFRLWDDRLLAEVDDVAPLLESAWSARNRVRPVLGALLGTQEIFNLLRELRDERFVDYYTARDVVTDDEMSAFEEFLFGLSHEDISALRRYRVEAGVSVVSVADARRILGPRDDAWEAGSVVGPQAIYTNYRRRRMLAMSRALTSAPGPKKVAEAWVLMAWLEGG